MSLALADPVDQTLKALADPTRRAIVQRLMCGSARVTEVAQPFAMSLNAVSKHIRVLEEAGLLGRARSGREHLLFFKPGPMDQLSGWLADQAQLWGDRLMRMDAALQAQDAARLAAGRALAGAVGDGGTGETLGAAPSAEASEGDAPPKPSP